MVGSWLMEFELENWRIWETEFTLEQRWLAWNLIKMCVKNWCGCGRLEPGCSPVVFREWRSGNRHKLKYRKFPLTFKKSKPFYCDSNQGCKEVVPVLGNAQYPTGKWPRKLTQVWAGGWTFNDLLRALFKLKYCAILFSCDPSTDIGIRNIPGTQWSTTPWSTLSPKSAPSSFPPTPTLPISPGQSIFLSLKRKHYKPNKKKQTNKKTQKDSTTKKTSKRTPTKSSMKSTSTMLWKIGQTQTAVNFQCLLELRRWILYNMIVLVYATINIFHISISRWWGFLLGEFLPVWK